MKRKSKTKAKPSTALARMTKKKLGHLPVRKRAELMPASTPAKDAVLARVLNDDVDIGQLGLVEIKLTEAEELILNEQVQLKDVSVKPSGQPYLSHPVYTRWLNRAFGRTGWQLVPASKPMKAGNSVVCPYVLYIHKQPVAFANGEQEYWESNKEQTYGDAVEATVASALRRCMKRLGVGLELWDRRWLDDYMDQNSVHVQVKGRDDKLKWVWRKKSDPPFWNEVGGKRGRGRQEDESEPAQRRPPAPTVDPLDGHHTKSKDPINEAQLRRLVAIFHNSGRSELEVQRWLHEKYKVDTMRKVPNDKYDEICRAIEGTGNLT